MNDNFTESKILSKKDYLKYENDYNDFITDVFDFNNGYMLVQSTHDDLNTLLDNGSETHNINIAIAAAITSYARMHMAQFKNNPDYNLYYSDTDSIFIEKPLPNDMIGSELGKMKLEYIFKESIFLASKVYGGHIQGEDRAALRCTALHCTAK